MLYTYLLHKQHLKCLWVPSHLGNCWVEALVQDFRGGCLNAGRACYSLSHVQLFLVPWAVDCQAPLSIGFSRQEYYSGLPLPSPGDLPDPGIEPRSPAQQADYLPSEPPGKPLNAGEGP